MVSYRKMSQQERDAYTKQSIEESEKKDKKWKKIRSNWWRQRDGAMGCVHYCELGLSMGGGFNKYIRY